MEGDYIREQIFLSCIFFFVEVKGHLYQKQKWLILNQADRKIPSQNRDNRMKVFEKHVFTFIRLPKGLWRVRGGPRGWG